jgi:sugar lactone lactonase YvrE
MRHDFLEPTAGGRGDVDPGFDVLASGLGYPEGPVWHGPRDVTFVELRSQRIQRWRGGLVEPLASPGGAPNGATLGADGALYVANNGGIAPLTFEELWRANDGVTGRIQRVTLDGACEDWATGLPGPEPRRPNDLRFGPDGYLYYTDPHNWEELPDRDRYGGGIVCRIGPDRHAEVVIALDEFPNGLAFSPDWRRLFVAQSANGKVQVMDLAGPQALTPREFCQVPAGAPDGITFDAAGRLYVAGSLAADGGDAVYVYGPDGVFEQAYQLPAGSDPTNLCLGDGGIYVTLGLAGLLIFIPHSAEPAALLP